MSDIRARRTATLAAAAKAKSAAKAHAADQAIRRLVRRGEPVTFQAVQREAGVSHAFLYGNPDLRARIEHLRVDPHRFRRHHPKWHDGLRGENRKWDRLARSTPRNIRTRLWSW